MAPVAGARFPGAGPAVSNLPATQPAPSPAATSVGAAARAAARPGRGGAAAVLPVEAVHGLGGVGKTELVIEFAHRFAQRLRIIWWIPAEQPTTAAAALAALAAKLGVAADGGPGRGDRGAVRPAARPRPLAVDLRQRRAARDDLAGLLPPGGGGHVLVTSRWSAWGAQAEPVRGGCAGPRTSRCGS